MTTLVLGATGATGRLLVRQLLDRGEHVRAIVRSPGSLPAALRDDERVSVIHASLLDLSDAELVEHMRGCRAVASCLGHTLSFKGIFGAPRRLVTDATRRLCGAIGSVGPEQPVRFVLMNTAGNSNRDLNEPHSLGHRCVLGLLRLLLPPHVDNEQASDHLRGLRSDSVEWVVVRPDSLIDEEQVSPYELHVSPTRDAIFDPGKTSRVNVGHLMAALITDDALWDRWRGQMPVVYNTPDEATSTGSATEGGEPSR